jgi:GT2 family glycosyltransferase
MEIARRYCSRDQHLVTLAALDLDVLNLPPALPEEATHDGAVILLRIDGRPCGQAILSFADPLDVQRPLKARLFEAADSAFCEAWLRHSLDLPPEQPPFRAMPDASVAICTRDRTDDLAKCLQGLMAMPDEVPIMVVDNAPSTEDTCNLVAQYPKVHYVRENRPGLDVARNTALRNGTSEIIAFIDDDAAPDRLWMRNLIRHFDDPMVMAATGLTMAMELESDAQIAFQRVGGFSRGFKHRTFHSANCDPFDAWHAGAGVNMALRRCIVEKVGLFDEALDAGSMALAGGDSDMFRRILAEGYLIAYDPEALNWHRHRRTMMELERQIYGYEVAAFAILTKALVYERNPAAALHILKWIRRQVPEIYRSYRYKRSLPFNTAITQAKGALAGPKRYIQARRRLRHD